MAALHKAHHRRGFTLIEALLAGVILALVGVAVAGAAASALRTAGLARGYERAAELLDLTMMRIDLIGPDRVMREGPLEGQFHEPYEAYRWHTTITPLATGDLYEVSVRVTWHGPAGPRSAVLATRLNDAPGSRSATLLWDEL